MRLHRLLFFFMLLLSACMIKQPGNGVFVIRQQAGSDITEQLQSILRTNPKEIYFEKGNYTISTYIHISNQQGLRLIGNGASITMKSYPGFSNPGLFKIYNSRDIHFEDLIIDGNRNLSKHHSTTCLYVINSKAVNFIGCTINNSTGDGINVTATLDQQPHYSQDITIEDCKIFNSTRNGISVVRGSNVKIINCEVTNSNGLRPQAGIDIEPDNHQIKPGTKNILIENNSFFGR